ncbi:hypothetical protein [Streptomyces sp. NPDC002172]
MIAVAASLLPVLGLLLHVMDRVEDWLGGAPPTAINAGLRTGVAPAG